MTKSTADRSLAGAPEDPEALIRLAADYDRWGLAPEAEVARLRARKIRVERLILDSLAVHATKRRRVREPRPGQDSPG